MPSPDKLQSMFAAMSVAGGGTLPRDSVLWWCTVTSCGAVCPFVLTLTGLAVEAHAFRVSVSAAFWHL